MRRFAWVLMVIWVGVYAASFIVPLNMHASGDGFTRGLNRVGTYLGYQTAAGLLAVWLWPLSRHLGQSRAVRWLGRVPALLTALMVVLIVGWILWARLSKPLFSSYMLPSVPVIQPVAQVRVASIETRGTVQCSLSRIGRFYLPAEYRTQPMAFTRGAHA